MVHRMRKTISLLFLSNTSSLIRQVTLSKPFAKVLGFLGIVCIILTGFVFYDYVAMKKAIPHARYLAWEIDNQQNALKQQHRHIQTLAGEINSLKAKLVSLNRFEEKIRIIANIKRTPGQESLFGVGGTIPEDIDEALPLSSDHTSLIRGMHEQTSELSLAASTQEKGFSSLIEKLQAQQNLLASTPAIKPADGWITSDFGYRMSPFTGQRVFHKALDIGARAGTPVIATANGFVTYAGNKGLLGKIVSIDHGHGMVTRYGHLNKILVKPGSAVKRGDQIGLVGTTGRTTGPHLHYEVQLNGVPVNPKRYILN